MVIRSRSRPRERGQGLVEYALILVLVAVVVIVILSQMGASLRDVYQTIACVVETGSPSDDCIPHCGVVGSDFALTIRDEGGSYNVAATLSTDRPDDMEVTVGNPAAGLGSLNPGGPGFINDWDFTSGAFYDALDAAYTGGSSIVGTFEVTCLAGEQAGESKSFDVPSTNG